MTLQAWLEEKPFTLALSSGFFGFFAHAGFLKALLERGLSPAAYTGSSAGAIVSGAAASGMSAKDIEALILGLKLEDFWDPAIGLGLVRGRKIQSLLEKHVGSDFKSLQKPLRVATFDILKARTTVFTEGPLARAIRASVSIPFMFHPVSIEGRMYWDGGIRDKMGIHGISPDERVLAHYLYDGKVMGKAFDQGPRGMAKNHRLLALPGLPRSGPNKLHLGPEILEAAYRQTLQKLQDPAPRSLGT